MGILPYGKDRRDRVRQDILTREYYSDNDRYADLINGLGCDGEQVVRKEDLEELDTRTGIGMTTIRRFLRGNLVLGRSRRRKLRGKMRDLIRKAAFGVNFAVVGVENQETIDYMLPLRSMVYEAGEYERQAAKIQREVRANPSALTPGEYLYGFAKSSRLHPSVTFVLYYGKEEWDGAKDLHGILDFTDIPKSLQKLVQNFQIHVIEVRKLKDTSMFRTDIRQVFDLIRLSESKEELRDLVKNDPAYQQMEEDAYDLAAFYTKTEGLIEKKSYYMEGDKVNMCGAIEGLMEDARVQGRAEGHAEGRAEGAHQLLALISAMNADGKAGDIPRLSEDPEFYQAMLKKYFL